MSALDWAVVAGGAGAIVLVLWYFFGAEWGARRDARGAAAAPPAGERTP